MGYEVDALIVNKCPGKRLMSIDTSGGHPAMDYPEHVRTYNGFVRFSIVLMVLVALILVYLLTLVP